MSTIYAPVVGENIRDGNSGSDGGEWIQSGSGKRWQPSSNTLRSSSLHNVHLRPAQEEAPPEPVQVPQYAQPYAPTFDAPQQAATNFTQGNDMASNHSGGTPTPPDPTMFDMYDEESARDYNQQLAAYIDGRVASALTPTRQAQSEAALATQYNNAVEKFGSDSNFKSVMAEALENCLRDSQAGRAINIEEAYQAASESVSRRPGQRTSHLPSKAKTIKGLGALIDFNHKSGRARPYRGR